MNGPSGKVQQITWLMAEKREEKVIKRHLSQIFLKKINTGFEFQFSFPEPLPRDSLYAGLSWYPVSPAFPRSISLSLNHTGI